MKCPICGGPLVSRTEEVTYRGIRIGEFRAWHSSDCGETILDHRAWSAVKRYDEFLAGRRTPTAVVDSPVGAVPGQLGGVSSTEFRLLWACGRESPDRDWGSFSPGHRATYAVGGNSPSLILM